MLELFHHAPAGVRAYAVDPVAAGEGFHLCYDGAVGVTFSDEPQLLAANVVWQKWLSATLRALSGRHAPPV